jgi:hypothetical protein
MEKIAATGLVIFSFSCAMAMWQNQDQEEDVTFDRRDKNEYVAGYCQVLSLSRFAI